jgi:hypothetical protein
MDDRLRRRLMPGSTLLEDPRGRAPVIPADIDVRTPVAEDGTATCEQCSERFPIARLNVTAHGYRCDACAARNIVGAAPAQLDDKNLKVGRGRWWLMPVVIAVATPIVILYPAATIVAVFVVAAVLFRFVLRRGL